MSKAIAHAVAERLNMRPSAIAQSFTATAAAHLQMLSHADPEVENAKMAAAQGELLANFGMRQPGGMNKPFAYANGMAFIPVTGMLINRFGQSWGGYVTGYNFIRTMMNLAIADPDVEYLIFDMNSYGGEVAGCFELADDMYAARGQKPMLAVVDSNCYSACMALASACDKIIVTPSGGAGSIGVICMHVNYAKMLEEFGVEITLITSGEHKADGNPYEALPESVKAEIKADCDKSRQQFAALVARNRGLEVEAVLATEAQSYRAEDAMALGLIDAVLPPTKAVTAFLNELSGSDDDVERDMTTDAKKPGTEGAETPAAAPAAAAPVVDTEKVASDARESERKRIAEIKGLPEAANKAGLADHLALNTDLSVDAAKGILAASPAEAAAPAGKSAFGTAMDQGGGPAVGADNGNDDPNAEGNKAAGILASHAMATGRSVK